MVVLQNRGLAGAELRPGGRARIALLSMLACYVLGANAVAQDPENCLFCHQFPGLSRLEPETNQIRVFYVDPGYTHHLRGAHARLACTDCHPRDEVASIPHLEISKVDCTRQCHIQGANEQPVRFSHAGAVDALAISAHKPEKLADLPFTGGPLLHPGQSICLYCHDEPVYRVAGAVGEAIDLLGARAFDRCDACHTTEMPVDTRFFLGHVASRLNPARSTLEGAQVCAVCHSDPGVTRKIESSDAVASYMRSFHGKAALLGDSETAGCVDCHVKSGENAHRIVGHEQPSSAVSAQNLGDTCSSIQCHPGADPAIAATAVHLDLATSSGSLEFFLAVAFIILTIFAMGPIALLTVLELLHRVFGWTHAHHEERLTLVERLIGHRTGRKLLTRLTRSDRYQHWALAGLFVILVATGFPLKFPEGEWSETIVRTLGGTRPTRLVHRWSGVALVIGLASHLSVIAVRVMARARTTRTDGRPVGLMPAIMELPLVPNLADLKKSKELLAYLLRRKPVRPAFGRFTIAEKLDYIGVVWGTILLGATGFMLWGEQIVSHWLGGRAFNIATIIHTYEAYLAVIHVGILHMAAVIFSPTVFPYSSAAFTDQTPPAKLAEEHGEFVDEVAAKVGIAPEGGSHGG